MPETTYTLMGLMDRIGPVTDDMVMIFVAGCDRGEFIRKGRSVATPRVTTDGPRLYGISLDFLANATPAARKAVSGLSEALLKAAIYAISRGDQLYQALQDAKKQKSGDRAVDSVAVEHMRAALVVDRDVLYEALATLAAGDRTWQAKLDTAYGTIATPKDLKKSLTDLSSVGREMLANTSPSMVALRETVALAEADLTQLESAAAEYEIAAAKAAGPMSAAPVSQADVDYWDGINLFLLRRIINIHEAGHARDPSVPRLIPISLYSLFHSSTATPPLPAEPPAADE